MWIQVRRAVGPSLVLVALIIVAVVAAVIGLATDADMFEDFWRQLFWLSLGTVLITFVVERLLAADLEATRRGEVSLGFRVTSAGVLQRVSMIVASAQDAGSEDFIAEAVRGSEAFNRASTKLSAQLEQKAIELRPHKYDEHFQSVSNEIDGLTNFLRIFSESEEQMADSYLELRALAARWRYRDELTERREKYIQGLAVEAPERAEAFADREREEEEVKTLIRDTARTVSVLANREATGRSMKLAASPA